jgi:predicted GNAT family acetyltransferase
MTSADRPSFALAVTDNPDARRYEVTANGELAGILTYRLHDDRVVFLHAEVDPKFEGHGVGSRLAREALDDVIAQGKQITPLCPFVNDYIHRHPEYVEHVDVVHRPEFVSA